MVSPDSRSIAREHKVARCYAVGMSDGGVPAGFTRETKIRRDRHGRWFDGGVLIENPAIIQAFDRWVDRAPDGRYCLKNDVNWAYVEIEGPPIFVKDARVDEEEIELILSDGRTERLDPDTLHTDLEGFLFCAVRDRSMEAQFTSQAAFRLEPILDEDDQGVYLTLGGRRFRPRGG